jgi:H+/Cl- antiporter ClcA
MIPRVDTLLCVLSLCGVAFSCVLLLNHMPREGRWIEKTLLAVIALGAVGVASGPFTPQGFDPSFAETLLYSGMGLFAMWMAEPYWCELPLLSRRRRQRPVAHDRRCL